MPFLGEIAGLLTSICWTFTSFFFTSASKLIGSFQVNLLRIPLALVLLFFTYLGIYGDFQATAFDFWMLAVSGIIGLVMGDTFLFEAFVRIGPRLALLVYSFTPAMTTIIAFFALGESVSLLGYAGISVTIFGIVTVVSEKKLDDSGKLRRVSLAGISFALLGGLGQALGLVLAKSALRTDINSLFATLIRIGAAAIFIWPAAAIIGRLYNPVKLLRRQKSTILYLVGGTIFGPFLGIWMSQVAIKYTDTGIASTFMSLMPILIIPIEVVFFGEKINLRAVTGTILAVAGVAILFLR